MQIDISIAKRERKCGVCGNSIRSTQRHFVTTDFVPKLSYPIKKNICLKCAESITDVNFLGALCLLIDGLKQIKVQLDEVKKRVDRQKGFDVPF